MNEFKSIAVRNAVDYPSRVTGNHLYGSQVFLLDVEENSDWMEDVDGSPLSDERRASLIAKYGEYIIVTQLDNEGAYAVEGFTEKSEADDRFDFIKDDFENWASQTA